MGLFNLLSGNSNNNEENNRDLVLQLNEESATVPAGAIAGRSLAQLFRDYLGADTDRIARYLSCGSVLSGNEVPQPGQVYRAGVNQEGKG